MSRQHMAVWLQVLAIRYRRYIKERGKKVGGDPITLPPPPHNLRPQSVVK